MAQAISAQEHKLSSADGGPGGSNGGMGRPLVCHCSCIGARAAGAAGQPQASVMAAEYADLPQRVGTSYAPAEQKQQKGSPADPPQTRAAEADTALREQVPEQHEGFRNAGGFLGVATYSEPILMALLDGYDHFICPR